MCGRYVAANDPDALAADFGINDLPDHRLAADFNVAPTKQVYVVIDQQIADGGPLTRRLDIARWGLIPSWAKDPSIASRLINARAETVAEKPSFRRAFARRRCLVPADGYYEWVAKQPYYLHAAVGRTLAMAGLYEWWQVPGVGGEDPDARRLTCTVITTAATAEVAQIHQRMPLIIDPSDWSGWLDPAATDASELLLSPSQASIVAHRVTTEVNNVRHNGPELTQRATV